jgi:hypothetical protein
MDERRKSIAYLAEEPPVVPDTTGVCDPMKFCNGDISLDDAIEHNGGHLVLSNVSLLFESNV